MACTSLLTGAILGPQQQFLSDIEQEMFQQGAIFRAQLTNQPHQAGNFRNNNSPPTLLTEEQRREDKGQGDRLTTAKRNGQTPTGGQANTMKTGNMFASPHSSPKAERSITLRGMFGPQPPLPIEVSA